jgi:hypothetical protein
MFRKSQMGSPFLFSSYRLSLWEHVAKPVTLILAAAACVTSTQTIAAPVTVDFTLDMTWTKFNAPNNQFPINGFLDSAGLPRGATGVLGTEPHNTVTGSFVYDPAGTYPMGVNTVFAKNYLGAITEVDFKIGSVSFSVDKPTPNNTGSTINTYEQISGLTINQDDRVNFSTISNTPSQLPANNRYTGSTYDFAYSIPRVNRPALNFNHSIGVAQFLLDLSMPGLLDDGIGISDLENNLADLANVTLPANGNNRAQILFYSFGSLGSIDAFTLDGQITSLKLRDTNGGGTSGGSGST